MNLIFKDFCPICNLKLDHSETYNAGKGKDSFCPNRCYVLYDYDNIQDITLKLERFFKVEFSIYKDISQFETLLYSEPARLVFKVDYLIPFEWDKLSKFEERLSKLVIFS